MKLFVKTNPRDLLTAFCVAALSTTALGDTIMDSSTDHSVTVKEAIEHIAPATTTDIPSNTMNITLSEADLRGIRLLAHQNGENYAKLGSTQLCIASNNRAGLNIKLGVGSLTSENNSVADSANLLVVAHSMVTTDTVGDFDSTGLVSAGTPVVISFSYENVLSTVKLHTRTGGNFSFPASGGAKDLTAALDLSSTSTSVAVNTRADEALGASYSTLNHYGVEDSKDVVTFSGDTEQITISNCPDSLIQIDLFVDADEVIDIRAGDYTTTILIDIDADS